MRRLALPVLAIAAMAAIGCDADYMRKLEAGVSMPMTQLADRLDSLSSKMATLQNRIAERGKETEEVRTILASAENDVTSIQASLDGLGKPPGSIRECHAAAQAALAAVGDYLQALRATVDTPQDLADASQVADRKAQEALVRIRAFESARAKAMRALNHAPTLWRIP